MLRQRCRAMTNRSFGMTWQWLILSLFSFTKILFKLNFCHHFKKVITIVCYRQCTIRVSQLCFGELYPASDSDFVCRPYSRLLARVRISVFHPPIPKVKSVIFEWSASRGKRLRIHIFSLFDTAVIWMFSYL